MGTRGDILWHFVVFDKKCHQFFIGSFWKLMFFFVNEVHIFITF